MKRPVIVYFPVTLWIVMGSPAFAMESARFEWRYHYPHLIILVMTSLALFAGAAYFYRKLLLENERNAREQALASEERYRLMFEHAADAIFICDMEGRIVDANQMALQQYGYTKEKILKLTIPDIDTTEDAVHIQERIAVIIRDGRAAFEAKHRNARGHSLFVDVKVAKILYDGKPCLMSVCRDITGRRLLEKEREQYFILFNTSSDLMCILNSKTGYFMKVNPAWTAVLGYTEQELLARPFTEFVHPDDLERTLREVTEQFNCGYTLDFENRYPRKDGAIRWFSWLVTADKETGIAYATARDITENRAAADKLRTSEENLRRAQAVAHIGSWHFDIVTNKGFWSEETHRLFGVPLDSPITFEIFFEHIHPDDREKVAKAWERALATGGRYDVEHRIIVNGDILWVRELGQIERDAGERPIFAIGTVQDITERKLNQDALNYANECFSQALNSSNHVLYRLNVKKGCYDYLSPSFETITGHPVNEFKTIGLEQLAEYFHPDDRHHIFDSINKTVSGRAGNTAHLEFEYRLRKADGNYCWFHDSTTACVDDDGGLQCFFGSAHDITERKQYEMEIRTYQDIVQSSDDAIISKTLDGIVTSWNPGAEKIFGYEAKEMIGKSITILFPPELIDEERDVLERIAQGGTVHHYVSHRIHKNGSPLNVSVTISPILDEEGRIIGVSKIARDITELIKHEHELEEARGAADAANRAKSEFLANMSHEIRTPMNGIFGMAQLLECTSMDEEQKECLDIIKTCSDSLLAVINDVLDLSKIEAGKIELEQRDFSLRGTIGDVVKTQISRIHDKGLRISADIPAAIPDNLNGDQLRLKQILFNLLSNAIKFTEKGKILITATITERQDTTALVKIGVMDSGIGISPDAIGKIFEPFVQADASTTRKYGGTGLGLAICARLATLMNGKIWAESIPGAGSTFYLQLPLTVRDTAAVRHDRRKSDRSAPQWDGQPLRILIVDDQESNRFVASKALRIAGHSVVEAGDGPEALLRWEQEPFDLMLLDVQMPLMSGLDVIRFIRERERETGRHLPVIAVTAFTMREDRSAIMSLGFDGYLAKPILLDALFAEMRRCLPGTSPAPPAGEELPELPQAAGPAAPELDREHLLALLEKLEELLKNGNMAVLDKTAELTAALPASAAAATFSRHVKRYDFDGALGCLAALYEECEIKREGNYSALSES